LQPATRARINRAKPIRFMIFQLRKQRFWIAKYV
jgi:hypothetical protein